MSEEIMESREKGRGSFKKEHQNLLALSVILGGLFLGSLFVDIAQLVQREGFSASATRTHTVLETNNKTWVAYSDPLVPLQVLTDRECKTCDASEALVWLRRVVPTLQAKIVDINDDEGKILAQHSSVITLPAFLFGKDILHTDFYTQASSLFEGQGGRYFFDMGKIGLAPGRYLKLPATEGETLAFGPTNAKVTIVTYFDFECPFCKKFHDDLKQAVAPYAKDVRLIYKHYPLSFHAQSENAALASECANAQGKFDSYANLLFDKQVEWSATPGLQKFKDYAYRTKLNYKQFSQCLESREYAQTVEMDKEEAGSFSITGTPATFIGGTLLSGAVSKEDLETVIKEELAR